jgi:hypothetical protein
MAENWIPFVRGTETGRLSCMTDVQHRRAAGVGMPGRDVVLIIHVMLENPDDHGMGTHEEAAEIDAAFEQPSTELTGMGAVFTSRSRHNGRMTFCIYTSAADAVRMEQIARGAFTGRSVSVEHRADPKWEVYQQLLPDAQEERLVLDSMVVQAMQEQGDPLTPKRDVRHFAYFPKRSAAEQFSKSIQAEGFTVELGETEGQHSVTASRNDSVTLEAINPITTALSEKAASLGGEYDGWEAMLMKKKRGLLGRLLG